MIDSPSKRNYRNLLRFYGYALPYWKMILLSLAAMVLYSAVSVNAVFLVKPLIRAFRERASAAQEAAPGASPAAYAAQAPSPEPTAKAAGEDEDEAGPTDLFERLKARISGWFLRLPGVQQASVWLWHEASLKRLAFVVAVFIGPLFLVSGFLQEYARGRVVWSVLADLRVRVFDRLCRLSLGYFSGQRTGELVSRLTNDITLTQSALKVIFGKIILQPMMLVVFLAAGAWASPQLTVVSLLALPLLALMMGRYGARIRRHATKTLERVADITDSVTQMLSGVRVVKSFNMEDTEKEMFVARNRAQLRRAFKLVWTESWAGVLPVFFMSVMATAGMLLLADYLLNKGLLTLDDMVVCVACLTLASGRVRRIVRAYNDLQRSMAGVNRVLELVDMVPDIQDSPDAVELAGVREGIRFRDVWFAYDRQPVLKGIDLFVPRGKTYAIVGETGAGKSTMLDLIPRFYDTAKGSVDIDGLDVRRIKRKSLMRQIAIVGQHPFLFNRPIAENIRYGKPDATGEEVASAARAANIHDFILGLPEGYGTVAGEAGDRFSGGQRQCLTIARAILRNAPILILDEATSSLDAESEMLVQRALKNLMQDRTTLVIAHRLSTVRHADRIVVLKGGRIVEQGTHEELLQSGGEYERLYGLQFADPADEEVPPDAP